MIATGSPIKKQSIATGIISAEWIINPSKMIIAIRKRSIIRGISTLICYSPISQSPEGLC